MIDYSILIPAYNAENTLSELLLQLKKLKQQPIHIYLIDDGSKDRTSEIAKSYEIDFHQLDKNKGKGFALRLGFDNFLKSHDSQYLLCMDADLQHPVSHVQNFLSAANGNNEKIIIGRRQRNLNVMPFLRILSNSITSFILTIICKQKIQDSQCGFRLIHSDVIKRFDLREEGFQLESEMIIQAAKNNFQIKFVEIPTIYNGHISHINHLGDTLRFIKLIIREVFYKK